MTHAESPPPTSEPGREKLEALVEAMFLAAFADGEFCAKERKHFVASIESLTDWRMPQPLLETLLARAEAELARDGRKARLAAVKERLPSQGERRAALVLAVRLVAADGIIRTSERDLVFHLAEALEIERDVATELLKKETTS